MAGWTPPPLPRDSAACDWLAGVDSPVLAAALLSSFKHLVRIVRAMHSRDLLVF